MNAPPAGATTPSVIHEIRLLHREIYIIGRKLPKRDKLGIHKQVEDETLALFASLIEATFTPCPAKLKPLGISRVKTSLIQHLIRIEDELGIIDETTYMRISSNLVEIAKQINGWISDTLRRSGMQKRP